MLLLHNFGVTCGLPATGTGILYPWVRFLKPAVWPVPVWRVRVFTGKGTGTTKFTRGLPVQFTKYDEELPK
jgi:hypothetical protein